jgi:hypothetical protein
MSEVSHTSFPAVPMIVTAYVVVTDDPNQFAPGWPTRWRRLITLSELEAKSEAAQLGGYVVETWALVVDKQIWPLQPPLALGPREGRGELL